MNTDTHLAHPLTVEDVCEFFGVAHAEFEPDGTIYVAGPIEGYYLCREEICSCLRHLSARRGVAIVYRLPSIALVARNGGSEVAAGKP